MIVEFDTIRRCLKESYERDQQEEAGITPVPFETVNDYKTKISIELNRIVDFTGGQVWFNGTAYECVYAYDDDNIMTPNLFISYDDFKKLYETYKSIKILRHEEL